MYNPLLLTAKEASDMLRVPLSTLYRLTKKGQVKGFKVGKQWRYIKEDILKYFNTGYDFIQQQATENKSNTPIAALESK